MKITELYEPEARAHLIHLNITGQSLLQTEYRPSSSREYGLGSDGSTSGMMIRPAGVGGEEECHGPGERLATTTLHYVVYVRPSQS